MTDDRLDHHDGEAQDQVRDRLHQAIPDLAREGPGPAATHAQLERRERRRRMATGTAVLVLVAAGGLAVIQQGGDAQRVILDDGPGVVAPGSEGGAEEPSAQGLDLRWSVSEGGLDPLRSTAIGPDGFLYALSTAPGVTYDDATRDGHFPQAVYRSADGVTWQATPLDGIPPSYAVEVGAGVLYSLSTAPAGTEGPPGIATSADGGASWSLTELPTLPAPDADVRLTPYTTVGGLAVGAQQAVAFVRTSFFPHFDGEEAAFAQMTATGVQATDFEACRAAEGDPAPTTTVTEHCVDHTTSRPWTDFGLQSADELLAQAVHVGGEDGWEHQPVAFGGGLIRGITATAGGFLAVSGGRHPIVDHFSPFEAWTSVDGRDWVLSVELPEPLGEVVAVGTVEGQGVVVGRDHWHPDQPWVTGGTAAWQHPDGRWTFTDLATVVDQPGQLSVMAADIGPLGAAVVVSVGVEVDPDEFDPPHDGPLTDPPMGTHLLLLISRDGTTWQTIDLRAAVTDADIAEPRWIAVGPDTISLGIHTATPRLTNDDGVLLNVPRQERQTMTLVGTPMR